MKEWSVWVGDVQVNDYYLDLYDALQLAEHWRVKGYDDVQVDKRN